MTAFGDIIAGAAFRSDLQDSQRVLQAEWIALAGEAIDSTWNVLAAARPDFQVASEDFSVQSGASASFAVPYRFHSIIDVVFGPDTSQEYSLGPYNWHNRRSPGGWIWPMFGGAPGGPGATRARLMGTSVYVEPSLQAAGTYRLWYCPKAHTAAIVRLASVAALPACVAAGSGAGKTLTASANGALSVDGQAVAARDILLIKDQVATANNGIYTVVQPGSGGTPFILIRTPGFDQTSLLSTGQIVGVGQSNPTLPAGTQEGAFFTLTTFSAIESAQSWTAGASIDAILEQFVELLKVKTAIPALRRDKRLETVASFQKDEQRLIAEAKNYFATTRAPGPQRMIDTDATLFPGGWGGW
jgi:hypothetical protein